MDSHGAPLEMFCLADFVIVEGLIPHAGANAVGAIDPGMIEGDGFAFTYDFLQRNRRSDVAMLGHHHAKDPIVD